jgi:hypothetical protein
MEKKWQGDLLSLTAMLKALVHDQAVLLCIQNIDFSHHYCNWKIIINDDDDSLLGVTS